MFALSLFEEGNLRMVSIRKTKKEAVAFGEWWCNGSKICKYEIKSGEKFDIDLSLEVS
jgi:hypothetical protein